MSVLLEKKGVKYLVLTAGREAQQAEIHKQIRTLPGVSKV